MTAVGDSKLKILDSEALRRNVGKDKIVRMKALMSHEKSATAFGNLKVDNDKNWTIFFGLTQVRLTNRLYYSSCFLNKTVSNVHKGYIKMFTFLNTNYAVL